MNEIHRLNATRERMKYVTPTTVNDSTAFFSFGDR